ncbi:MAG: hypothetical protein J0H78_14625 [Rhizobiales bacterium]|nr:hypothetical protein [Hyphomicrobiales bacterium]
MDITITRLAMIHDSQQRSCRRLSQAVKNASAITARMTAFAANSARMAACVMLPETGMTRETAGTDGKAAPVIDATR